MISLNNFENDWWFKGPFFDNFSYFHLWSFLDYLTWFPVIVCFVLLLYWFSIILSLFTCHIWEIAVKIEIVAFLEYLVFIYIFIYILYNYYILYSRTIWEKTRYSEIAFIWILIKFDFARTFKGNTQAKAERNTKETMRDQKLSS